MLQNMKLVSVIITAYNQAPLVIQAIESVLLQTYRPIEIIVVDDGSTDDTKQQLLRFGDAIRYVYKDNGGACSARNTGIHLAQGEYIALLDGDDRYLPRKIEESIKCFEKYPDIGFVHTAAYFVDREDRILRVFSRPESRTIDWIGKKLLFFDFVCNSTVVVRKSCFETVGLYDESIFSAADWDLWMRLAVRYKAGFVNVPLTKYRLVSNYILNHLEEVEAEDRLVLDRALARYPDLGEYAKRKAHSNLSLQLATANLHRDDMGRAKTLFQTSIKQNPLNIKAWVYAFCFFVAPKLFQKQVKLRRS